ncbi:RidA family protein [soil metagenome]
MEITRVGNSEDKPYSTAVIAGGRFVFVSGQIPTRGGQLVGGSIAAQTEVALENLVKVLESAGATLDDVTRCSVFLADLRDLPAFNVAYLRAFGSRLPARTAVGAELPGYGIEIDCIAVIPELEMK